MPSALPDGWIEKDNVLVRTVQRADFVEVLAYVLAVGELAEAANHHPDIDIRYNKVHFNLCTHDAGHKVTAKDLALAQKINDLNENAVRLSRDDLRRQFQA